MLLNRYLSSNKNLPEIMSKIIEGAPPNNFNVEHLKAIGFGGSNDRAVVPLLKELGFLTADGSPTERYREYRDKSRSKSVMANALREKYSDLFAISEIITESHKEAVIGRFKSVHSATDDIAARMAATFFSLLKLADLNAETRSTKNNIVDITSDKKENEESNSSVKNLNKELQLAYNIQIQLPATKDIEIYNAIFKSIKSNLME